eukprot:4437032-Pleurochrysis_carterae.AAC.2
MSTVLESGHKIYGIGHRRRDEVSNAASMTQIHVAVLDFMLAFYACFIVHADSHLRFVTRALAARQATGAQRGMSARTASAGRIALARRCSMVGLSRSPRTTRTMAGVSAFWPSRSASRRRASTHAST